MRPIDYPTRSIPEYYDAMYLDGYKPWEVMEAVHKMMRRKYVEPLHHPKPAPEKVNLHITSEVKIK